MQTRFFPSERLETSFPWPLWAVGWLAVLRASLWLAWEPALAEPLVRLVGWKYLLGALPFLACAAGLWRRERWAAWGMIALAAADLAFLALWPRSFPAYLVDSEILPFAVLLSGVMLVCGGPLGDAAVLVLAPRLLRLTAGPRPSRAAGRQG